MKKKDIIKSEPEFLGVKREKRLTKQDFYVDDPEKLLRKPPKKFVKVEEPSVKEEAAADAQAEVKEEVKQEPVAILAPAADIPEEPEPEPEQPEEEEEEEEEAVAPGIKHPDKRSIILNRHYTKRKPLPIMAHNYNFWADLIFAPGSRTEGMVLFVEGTSRWCMCYPFRNKSAQEIAGITDQFINDIDRRITSLITDAGTEWNGIPHLAKKYAFSWRRKNTALVGHGGMARLDRTVRTLRLYIDYLSNVVDNPLTWREMFERAVEIFNSESHTFSKPYTPSFVLKYPNLMHQIRINDYMKGWQNYRYIWPYADPANKDAEYYVEVDKTDPTKRFKYMTFEKGRDRHVYSKIPRKIDFVIGNKFLLDNADFKKRISDQLYDAEQLLPVRLYETVIKPHAEKRDSRYIDYALHRRPGLVNKKRAIIGDNDEPAFSADFSEDDIN